MLNSDSVTTHTDFQSTKIKEKKIKLLIEELPTIEQVKKNLLEIYDGFPCCFCADTDETFNHVWLCEYRRTKMISIIIEIKAKLVELINQELEERSKITLQELDSLSDLWRIRYCDNNFSFIDIIKGIIPLSLSEFTNQYIHKQQTTFRILNEVRDLLY